MFDLVLHFYPCPTPKGMWCQWGVRPLDELKVQVWLLFDHQNFNYCTLYVSGKELQTDRLTNGQTDRQRMTPRCPWQTLQARGIKSSKQYHQLFRCQRRRCHSRLPTSIGDLDTLTPYCFKPRPWGIKGAQVNFLPSLSPAAKSFTPLQGVYIAR